MAYLIHFANFTENYGCNQIVILIFDLSSACVYLCTIGFKSIFQGLSGGSNCEIL